MSKTISLIAAVAHNNVIGGAGNLVWHIPEDLRHFKAMTRGKTVLMGRKTWDSLPPKFRPLPERRNVVISRNPDFQAAGAEVFTSFLGAIAAMDSEEICVIGGGEIYAQAMAVADMLYLTHIDADFQGDTFFPDIKHWQEISRQSKQDEYSGLLLHFASYEKKSAL